MSKIQTLKGFRDFLPEEMQLRNYVIETCKKVFESFGFEPLETPALEYSSTLLGKYGKEADKLVYTFKDKGSREVGLRYDLTVPVSRVLAQYSQQIPLPFKRYQLQTVWRAEKPQKGRYREVLQCDIDTFGVKTPVADAEIVAVIYQVLKKLGFKKIIILINSRQVLFKLLEELGIKDSQKQLSILQSVDKLRKQGEEEVNKELKRKGFSDSQVKNLLEKLESIQPDDNLKKMFGFIEAFGVPKNFYQFAPSMVRGLDYYTGPIFETVVEPDIGSLTGGGRYDKLISQLGGPDIPGTGTTIGIDRICEVIGEKKLLPKINKTAEVLVTVFPEYLAKSIQLANKLREVGINVQLYLEEKPINKQLKYADKKGIPYVVILGPEEIKEKKYTLKDMKTGKQKKVNFEELLTILKDESGKS